ncbi:hypothetical protein CORC01_08875 [Colletotrichum orchidophilum]|uniref:Uncharacterized protein n=1 Tax=Colletotrichum orchidophilum TaxID=1209926 RepID=A0A1G4B376_9PEZI|nr:uncharacterized protein CORC01_08875 [Colletotrichum orchidophilum]OHE95878.1 hypothetical protein CORC01_08875 [Colletotrichum orchidophilum]
MTLSLTASSSTNGTALQTFTANTTHSLTSSMISLPPFPTSNSTQSPWPTAANASSIPSSTVYSGTVASKYTSIGNGLPPFPTTNSTPPPAATATINGTVILSGSGATMISTGVTGLPSSSHAPPFPVTNSTALPGPTGSGTGISYPASGTVFQTSEPPETSNSIPSTIRPPPFPTGNGTAIPRPTWISGSASGLPISTFTTTRGNSSITETLSNVPSSGLSPPFPTFNSTTAPGATGTSAGTRNSVTWPGTGGPFGAPTDSSSTWGQWPNSTASSALSATGIPTGPSGTPSSPPQNVTATTTNGTAFSTGFPPITLSSPSSLPPFSNSTTISEVISTPHVTWTASGTVFSSVSILPVPTLSHFNSSTSGISSGISSGIASPSAPSTSYFSSPGAPASLTESAQPAVTNSTGLPPGTSWPCHTVTSTNGTITQVVTTSVLITSATASADPTWAYPPSSLNNTTYPPRPSCTSKWQNITIASSAGLTSTWTSSVQTDRTWISVNPATTFVTSTTSRLSNPSKDSGAIPDTSFSVAGTPTTTISNAPLPSSPAYPWGGLGPIFRHNSATDPVDDENGSPDGPVVQERSGIWWARWKKHMDRLAPRHRARDRAA